MKIVDWLVNVEDLKDTELYTHVEGKLAVYNTDKTKPYTKKEILEFEETLKYETPDVIFDNNIERELVTELTPLSKTKYGRIYQNVEVNGQIYSSVDHPYDPLNQPEEFTEFYTLAI